MVSFAFTDEAGARACCTVEAKGTNGTRPARYLPYTPKHRSVRAKPLYVEGGPTENPKRQEGDLVFGVFVIALALLAVGVVLGH